eukprot:1614481-Rhodomonas_salina.1
MSASCSHAHVKQNPPVCYRYSLAPLKVLNDTNISTDPKRNMNKRGRRVLFVLRWVLIEHTRVPHALSACHFAACIVIIIIIRAIIFQLAVQVPLDEFLKEASSEDIRINSHRDLGDGARANHHHHHHRNPAKTTTWCNYCEKDTDHAREQCPQKNGDLKIMNGSRAFPARLQVVHPAAAWASESFKALLTAPCRDLNLNATH